MERKAPESDCTDGKLAPPKVVILDITVFLFTLLDFGHSFGKHLSDLQDRWPGITFRRKGRATGDSDD
jgi:hypothetical protein